MERDKSLDAAFAFFAASAFVLVFAWLCFFDVIHTDESGKPVVCDVMGTYRTIDTPECQEALAGNWNRTDNFVWRGTCDADTKICVPAKSK